MKKILVIGSGGREHALVWKLKQSPHVSKIFCAPGNGGTQNNIPIQAQDIEQLKEWVLRHKIDFTVVGPEKPLMMGIADLFETSGLKIFGVNQKAAQLESSKIFAKKILKKYHIPTANFEVFEDFSQAKAYVLSTKVSLPMVVKADGLAAGKGVVICQHKEEALKALSQCLEKKIFGDAGKRVIVEEFLEGEELSYLGFLDGETFLPLASSQDYKKIFDHDRGPNTGGMGAYSPLPWFDEKWESEIQRRIISPLLKGLKEEDIRFHGVLYIGLLVQKKVPYVLEFNVRFGDPEAQVLLFRLQSDLLPLLEATAKGRLREIDPSTIVWDPRPSVCVVMSSKGYPGDYETGFEIQGLSQTKERDRTLFHAGTVLENGKIKTAGGRVLNMVAKGDTYQEAKERAYQGVSQIQWKGAYYRKDIGYQVCQREK